MQDGKLDETRATAYGRKVSQALLYLGEGYSLERAATSAGVKHITLWTWMQEEAFLAVLACLQEYAIMRRAFDTLDGLLPDAVDAMRRTMQTGSPGQALEAARDVFKRVEARVAREEQAREDVRQEIKQERQRQQDNLDRQYRQYDIDLEKLERWVAGINAAGERWKDA